MSLNGQNKIKSGSKRDSAYFEGKERVYFIYKDNSPVVHTLSIVLVICEMK
jgi:hypothetical protein